MFQAKIAWKGTTNTGNRLCLKIFIPLRHDLYDILPISVLQLDHSEIQLFCQIHSWYLHLVGCKQQKSVRKWYVTDKDKGIMKPKTIPLVATCLGLIIHCL